MWDKQKAYSKMVDLNTLNIKGPNAPIKRLQLKDYKKHFF